MNMGCEMVTTMFYELWLVVVVKVKVVLWREIVLFLKESLTNAQKHAGATSVTVRINWSDSTLTMRVGDNGSGFDLSSPETGRGRGLLNFQARARVLGGTCHIESAPGAGTNVILEIPLPRH